MFLWTAVLIKFDRLRISSSFLSICWQEIHVLLLSAYTDFLH
jgi:hypothetical protein